MESVFIQLAYDVYISKNKMTPVTGFPRSHYH